MAGAPVSFGQVDATERGMVAPAAADHVLALVTERASAEFEALTA